MKHSAASEGAARRWGVRTTVLLAIFAILIALWGIAGMAPALAGTCEIDGTAVTTVASQAECDALVALYTSTDGPNWVTSTGWSTPTDPCGWYGVICDAGVTTLDLESNALSGPIPPEIGDLANLDGLVLWDNLITRLPPELGDLDNLWLLVVAHNLLSGDITAAMAGVEDTVGQLWISDGPGGNTCLSVTDLEVAAWLGYHDHDWDECGVVDVVVVGGPAVVSDEVLAKIEALVSGSVTRVWGANRYATAAALSHATFSPGVGTAFIATGQNFPDALTASSAAGVNFAPILLVAKTSIPAETASELVRLQPGEIVVVGGAEAVSESVMSALDGYTSGAVTRVFGANRYGTAAAVSASTFSPGVGTAFIATGEDFPDALAGGPAGIVHFGPVLLTRSNGLPSETAAELARLNPEQIFVLGGSAVVSDSVIAQLESTGSWSVSRHWGANRYETAAAVSEAAFPVGKGAVFIVTGVNFPDAVSAGPVAGLMNAPILLVAETSVTASTASELTRLGS